MTRHRRSSTKLFPMHKAVALEAPHQIYATLSSMETLNQVMSASFWCGEGAGTASFRQAGCRG